MRESGHLTTIDLLDEYELKQLEHFLPCYFALKIANNQISQKAWDLVGQMLSDLDTSHCLAIIREENKEVSNRLSQLFGIRHACPQLILISQGKAKAVWNEQEIFSEDSACSPSINSPKSHHLARLKAYRLLTLLPYKERGDQQWHKQWLADFNYIINAANPPAALSKSLEHFCQKWQTVEAISESQLEKKHLDFFEQAAQLQVCCWQGLGVHDTNKG